MRLVPLPSFIYRTFSVNNPAHDCQPSCQNCAYLLNRLLINLQHNISRVVIHTGCQVAALGGGGRGGAINLRAGIDLRDDRKR